MENNFDKDIFQEIHVSKFVDGMKQTGAQWITLPLDEFVNFRDQVIAVDSIAITTSGLDVACPWFAAWCQRELTWRPHRVVDGIRTKALGNAIENRFHGICMTDNKASEWNKDNMPKVLRKNVADFFMSNLQARYLELKGDILKCGSIRKCCENNLKNYYADETRKEGRIECFLLMPNETGSPNNSIENFVIELLENDVTSYIMQQCCFSPLERLCKYGVPLKGLHEQFPPLLQFQHSRIDPVQVYGIIPMEAIKRMFLMCQILEQQNYIYYINPNETEVPVIHLYVPSSEKKFVVSAKVRVQTGLCSSGPAADVDILSNGEFVRNDHRVHAMTTVLNLMRDAETYEESMKNYVGIQSIRFPETLNFEL